MAKPIIERLKKPCTIIIKHDGKKVFKKEYPMVSELLHHLNGSLDHEVTAKIAKHIYR